MKILVVHKNWLGDVIMELPFLQTLARGCSEGRIGCVVREHMKELLEAQPFVHTVIPFDERQKERGWLARIDWALRRKKEHWDVVYLLHRSKTRAALMALAGIPKRIGYGLHRRFFLTHAYEPPQDPCHRVDYFLQLLRLSGMPFEAKALQFSRLTFPKASLFSIRELLGRHGIRREDRYVCFHLGANWPPKRWPVGHYAKLAKLLWQKDPQLFILLTGSAKDQALHESFFEALGNLRNSFPAVSLAGRTSLLELAALFSEAQFLVSGDSGPMHLGAAVGVPLVALFGPTSPAITGPRGAGECIVLEKRLEGYPCPWDRQELPPLDWLARISPEEVMDKIQKSGWLKRKRPLVDFKAEESFSIQKGH